ncbi:MAG: Multidrug resistance protein MdtK [Chroococcidiopsis sp. SAG 2025]|uniref:MATE family efflux transporter n=1 Tax=Chroococcidiopsis sp. SAG 2025 TaxID=171389 RepID=UPI002936E84C|nr:MATE family efflux transporter [Chroococcidiopsis sp. SAG 2025]MDV2991230.1 Multidrug resistance protein MdtK [Chroococcidiopsis sp. SAG 2025]
MALFTVRTDIRTEIKEFLKLAIPLVSAQVAQSATGFVDTVMMGRLGQEILAAGGLASITFLTLLTTGSGIVMGVSPLVAEAYGANQKTRVERVARQGLWIALMLAIPLMLMVRHLDTLMLQLGQPESLVKLADTYLDVVLWGVFPALGFAVLRGVVSGVSQARPVMAIVISGTLFNIVGNYVLGYGKLGFPQMGLAGLALASALTFWLMFLALAIYIFRHPKLRQYRIFQEIYRLRPKIIGELLWLGAPIGVATALEYGLFNIVTFLMGTLGTDVLAAHQIVLQTTIVIYMVPLGMSYATTVRVGQWFGQLDLAAAKRAGYVSMSLGTGLMVLTAIALLIYPQQVVGLFIDLRNPANASVLSIAVPMLSIAALGEILDGVQRTANGALQGLQDTRIPMLLGFLAYWGAGLTSGYLLGFHFGLGGVGLWIGQSIGLTTAAVFFTWRFREIISCKQLQSSLCSCTPNS